MEDIALVRYVYENGQALVNMAWGVGPVVSKSVALRVAW